MAMFEEAIRADPIVGRLNSADSILRLGILELLSLSEQWVNSVILLSSSNGLNESLRAEVESITSRIGELKRHHPELTTVDTDFAKAKLCFFCSKNQFQDGFSVKVSLHGGVNENKTAWHVLTVEVPRCAVCFKAHSGIFYGLLRFWPWNIGDWEGGAFGLVLRRLEKAIRANPSAYLIGRLCKPLSDGIGPEYQAEDYPRVKALLAQGWMLGAKPPVSAAKPSEEQQKAKAQLTFNEYTQGCGLLAFALTVSGSQDCFPALIGVSLRSRRLGVVDLVPHEVLHPGTVICLIEHPADSGDFASVTTLRSMGEITFALWRDNFYRSELARIPWREWAYTDSGNPNPSRRIDPRTAGYLGTDFETMRQRYIGRPHWTAHPIHSHPATSEIRGFICGCCEQDFPGPKPSGIFHCPACGAASTALPRPLNSGGSFVTELMRDLSQPMGPSLNSNTRRCDLCNGRNGQIREGGGHMFYSAEQKEGMPEGIRLLCDRCTAGICLRLKDGKLLESNPLFGLFAPEYGEGDRMRMLQTSAMQTIECIAELCRAHRLGPDDAMTKARELAEAYWSNPTLGLSIAIDFWCPKSTSPAPK